MTQSDQVCSALRHRRLSHFHSHRDYVYDSPVAITAEIAASSITMALCVYGRQRLPAAVAPAILSTRPLPSSQAMWARVRSIAQKA